MRSIRKRNGVTVSRCKGVTVLRDVNGEVGASGSGDGEGNRDRVGWRGGVMSVVVLLWVPWVSRVSRVSYTAG